MVFMWNITFLKKAGCILLQNGDYQDHDPPIVLSGHFDTVPLGNKKWDVDPFAGQVQDGKILGTGFK